MAEMGYGWEQAYSELLDLIECGQAKTAKYDTMKTDLEGCIKLIASYETKRIELERSLVFCKAINQNTESQLRALRKKLDNYRRANEKLAGDISALQQHINQGVK